MKSGNEHFVFSLEPYYVTGRETWWFKRAKEVQYLLQFTLNNLIRMLVCISFLQARLYSRLAGPKRKGSWLWKVNPLQYSKYLFFLSQLLTCIQTKHKLRGKFDWKSCFLFTCPFLKYLKISFNKKLTPLVTCLLFCFLTPDWLFHCNTISFQKYFWC